MKLIRWLLLFSLVSPLFAQNTRWDLPVTTVQAQGGNLLPVYAVPGAGVVFYLCSGSTCSTLATTYISATSATTCPTSPVPAQVVLQGSTACVSSADPYGNMGSWFASGQYMATITASGASYNYYFTIGGGGSGGGYPGVTSDGANGLDVVGGVESATVTSSVNRVINVMATPYSAACNLVVNSSGGTISASSTTLTGSGFTAASVGQTVVIWGAGAVQTNGSYAPLVTTVAGYTSSTSVTLTAAATTAVTSGAYEIGTLDTTAIQTAYNAAAAAGASLLFPSNAGKSCLTGTIDLSAGGTVSYPVTRRGQGSVVSQISGLPGQDIFQWPDGKKMASAYQHLEGLNLVVDASLDVSSATGGAGQIWNPCNYSAGACTTPGYTTTANRVTGQCANGSGGLTACSPAISPGSVAFLGGSMSISSDATCDELTIPTYGGQFSAIPSWQLAGMPIAIPSISITGTITKFVSNTQVIISPAYGGTCSSATSLSGTWGTPNTPPWYVGNVAEAIPASAGANSGAYQGIVDDIWITQNTGTAAFANHSGGMFFQQEPYWGKFSRLTIQNMYYGYTEAIPASGNQSSWTPDTSHYYDINISAAVPLVMYAGNHRVLDGISLYGANHPLSVGPIILNSGSNTAGVSTVTHFYHECWGAPGTGQAQFGNTGENQRWSGTLWNITGGALAQCNGPYVNWQASQSKVTDVLIGGPYTPTPSTASLQIGGNTNEFSQIVQLYSGNVNDTGLDNKVVVNQTGNTRRYAGSVAQNETGVLDGSFLNVNALLPFTSTSDLFTRCADWNIGYHSTTGTCAPDSSYLTDGNVSGWLWTSTSTSGYTVFNFYGTPMTVGTRVPKGTVYLTIEAQVAASTTATLSMKVYDLTAGNVVLVTCPYSLTATLAVHGAFGQADACLVNLSSVPSGDVLYLQFNAPTTTTSLSIAYAAFQPIPAFNVTPISLASGSTAVTAGSCAGTTSVANMQDIANCLITPTGVVKSFNNGFITQCYAGGTQIQCINANESNCSSAAVTGVPTTATSPFQDRYTSAATTNSCSGIFGANTTGVNYFYARQPLFTTGISFLASTDYNTTARIWIGLVGSSCAPPTFQASDTPSCSYVAIRYSTSAGDTNYECVSDSGTGTPQVQSIGVAPTTAYTVMSINIGASSATCTVGATSVTNSTGGTLPASTTAMYDNITDTTLANTALHMQISGSYALSQNGNF